jgi:hypothetical protein
MHLNLFISIYYTFGFDDTYFPIYYDSLLIVRKNKLFLLRRADF